ncbi:isochorismate synthase [Salinicola acroporae]|uniref:isochorismate synthase n=1 Tax=Salinicola acroporae TaxID=1541440 RepID=A0ABT6I4E7_9GAMM|nr:isochorismate synthase [Salinicola acroporae]MDH4572542.1 isochorismate synthase [Salinicola acroporae]
MTVVSPRRGGDVTPVHTHEATFMLRASQHHLKTRGRRAQLPRGPATTLGSRVHAFFAQAYPGPALLVGAMPFDRNAEDALYQPDAVLPASSTVSAVAPALSGAPVAEPSPDGYAEMVARCVTRLRDDESTLSKAVLARSLRFEARAPVDPLALAGCLERDPSVTTYAVPLPVNAGDAPAWLVGASPELLLSRRGLSVTSHPLAGSARRSSDPEEDAQIARALQASTKDLTEHRYVVDAIVDALTPLCSELEAPDVPTLHATETMWHLGSRIEGRLKSPAPSSAELAGLLHPTPAVCGTPRQTAMEVIQSLEPIERGFYAGAVGWVDAQGDGDWYVAIRCAHVQGKHLRLFAGAGIVTDSTPALEVEETAAKFMALLHALGIEEVTTRRDAVSAR